MSEPRRCVWCHHAYTPRSDWQRHCSRDCAIADTRVGGHAPKP